MKPFFKIGFTFLLISSVQLTYCRQNNRISLTGINFYRGRSVKYNLNDTIAEHGSVVLNYRYAARFSIDYLVDSLSQDETIKYKLEGFDLIWIPTTDCRSIMFTNLEPGAYLFRIGIFNDQTDVGQKTFKLVITPPFWKTWWFRMLTGLIFFGMFIIVIIVLIVINVRLNNKLKVNAP